LEKSGINLAKNIAPAAKTANALEAIDNMMGKTGKTQNVVDWLKSVSSKFTNTNECWKGTWIVECLFCFARR